MDLSIVILQEEKPLPSKLNHHRLQFWSDGYCMSSSRNMSKVLVVEFCNPTLNQAFSLHHDGKVIFKDEGLCVAAKGNSSQLGLVDCETENLTLFNLHVSGSNITLRHKSEQNVSLCVSTDSRDGKIYEGN